MADRTFDTATSTDPVLLYDGACGLCASSVQLVLRHDPNGPLRFASLQSAFGRAVVARHAALRDLDSMILIVPRAGGADGDGERVYVRSDAVLRLCRYLGGWWSLLSVVGRLAPRVLRDAIYAAVARHRHRLPGRERCVLPAPAERERFLA